MVMLIDRLMDFETHWWMDFFCRAAFMCGREPNFELSEEEKQELRKFKWDEFLAYTRRSITNKSNPFFLDSYPEYLSFYHLNIQ